jgi:hypothetical protein
LQFFVVDGGGGGGGDDVFVQEAVIFKSGGHGRGCRWQLKKREMRPALTPLLLWTYVLWFLVCSRSVLLYNGFSFLRIRWTYFPVWPFTRCKQIALSIRM